MAASLDRPNPRPPGATWCSQPATGFPNRRGTASALRRRSMDPKTGKNSTHQPSHIALKPPPYLYVHTPMGLHTVDWVVIAVHLVASVSVGLFVTRCDTLLHWRRAACVHLRNPHAMSSQLCLPVTYTPIPADGRRRTLATTSWPVGASVAALSPSRSSPASCQASVSWAPQVRYCTGMVPQHLEPCSVRFCWPPRFYAGPGRAR